MSTGKTNDNDQIQDIGRRFEQDAAFRSAAETDLQGTLRSAGIPDELSSRFALSDSDEHGSAGMGLRTERWICIYEGDTKVQCWCLSCPIA